MRAGRSIMGGLICLLIILASISQANLKVSSVEAQSESEVQYGLIFQTNEHIYLAKLLADNTWQVEPLPDYLLFGQYDVFMITPQWLGDGRLVAAGVAPDLIVEDADIHGTYLYEIDVASAEPQLLLDESVIDEESIAYTEALVIQGLSDDNNYLLVNTAIRYTSHVIDLASGQVQNFDAMGTFISAWQDQQVYLKSYMEETAILVDIQSGETLADFHSSFAELGEDALAYEAYPIGSGRWLFAYPYAVHGTKIFLYDAQSDRLTALGAGHSIKLNEDRDKAVFLSDYKMGVIDLTTLDIVQFPPWVNHQNPIYYFDDDTLVYWVVQEGDIDFSVSRWHWTGHTLIDEPVFRGLRSPYIIHPTGQFMLVSNEDETTLDLYTSAGEHLALNTTLDATIVHLLDDPRWVPFSENGAWLFLYVEYADGTPKNLAYNWQTGVSYEFPTDDSFRGYWFGNASPDEKWLLVQICTEDVTNLACQPNKLLAIQPEAGTEVVLAEAPLYDNFHYTNDQVLLWSPVLSK